MAKEKHSADKITEDTLHELLTSINARLGHLEDIEADNRETIIKLVKQGNTIVKFLSNIEIEVEEDFEELATPTFKYDEERSEKIQHIKEVVEKYMSKQKGLKEFEEELKKHKKEITPGTIGES